MGRIATLSEELLLMMHRGFDSVTNELIKESRDHSYKSEFIEVDKFLSKSNDGFCLDGKRCLEIQKPHALVIAGSGVGKTSSIVIPSILKSNNSMILNDPSGELLLHTGHNLKERGYDVIVINLSNSLISRSWNPMHRIKDKSDANKIAGMLVRATLGEGKDPFWNISATAIISLVIQIQIHQKEKYRTFVNTLHLLQQFSFNPKVLDALIIHTNNQQIINEYKNFISYDTKLRTSIIATAISALQIFSDPEVSKITAIDTLGIEDLRKGKRAIFIQCNSTDSNYYSVLISIFFEQMCKLLMSKLPEGGDSDRYVQFVLDEFPVLHLPSISSILSTSRKYLANVMLLCQDYAQVEQLYGANDAQTIRNNCIAKLYMTGLSYGVTKDLSQELGRFEYTTDTGNSVRELLTADEVRTMSADEAILLYGNAQPMKLKLTPYYDNPSMRSKTQNKTESFIGDAYENELHFLNME
ncbi:MAG: hypothetical protein JWN78_1612 [Bacteroidota bacterium]|nr:hypothetical protein [Bacteroidota bacterium]